jgi:hypothetical protein
MPAISKHCAPESAENACHCICASVSMVVSNPMISRLFWVNHPSKGALLRIDSHSAGHLIVAEMSLCQGDPLCECSPNENDDGGEVFSMQSALDCCRARQLTDEQRAAVANYFSIYKGTENGMAKLMIPPSGICQPSLERALDFIKDAWEEVPAPPPSYPQCSLLHSQAYIYRCEGSYLMLRSSAAGRAEPVTN